MAKCFALPEFYTTLVEVLESKGQVKLLQTLPMLAGKKVCAPEPQL